MTTVREKVDGAMARAVHPNTPVEEARTSAMYACKMIDAHKLLDHKENGDAQAPAFDPQNPFGTLFGIVGQVLREGRTMALGAATAELITEREKAQRAEREVFRLRTENAELRAILDSKNIPIPETDGHEQSYTEHRRRRARKHRRRR